MDHMEPRNVRFPTALLERLARISKDRGIKEPELIRRAVDEFVQRFEESAARK